MSQPDADDSRSVVLRFNNCINEQDLDGLAGLMSDDHTFVDTANDRIVGLSDCVAAWRGFFAAYPDYRNVITSATGRDEHVVLTGYSECAKTDLAGPALWGAGVRHGKVTEWRVYQDTPANRRQLAIE